MTQSRHHSGTPVLRMPSINRSCTGPSLRGKEVVPVEVGEGGVDLLVSNGLLKEHETRDRKAVGEACLAALEAWAGGRGARITEQG